VAKPPMAKPPVASPALASPPVANPPMARPPVAKPTVANPRLGQPPAAACVTRHAYRRHAALLPCNPAARWPSPPVANRDWLLARTTPRSRVTRSVTPGSASTLAVTRPRSAVTPARASVTRSRDRYGHRHRPHVGHRTVTGSRDSVTPPCTTVTRPALGVTRSTRPSQALATASRGLAPPSQALTTASRRIAPASRALRLASRELECIQPQLEAQRPPQLP
jgi:hypothetical protein